MASTSLKNELQKLSQVFEDPAEFYSNIINASGALHEPLQSHPANIILLNVYKILTNSKDLNC